MSLALPDHDPFSADENWKIEHDKLYASSHSFDSLHLPEVLIETREDFDLLRNFLSLKDYYFIRRFLDSLPPFTPFSLIFEQRPVPNKSIPLMVLKDYSPKLEKMTPKKAQATFFRSLKAYSQKILRQDFSSSSQDPSSTLEQFEHKLSRSPLRSVTVFTRDHLKALMEHVIFPIAVENAIASSLSNSLAPQRVHKIITLEIQKIVLDISLLMTTDDFPYSFSDE